MKKVSLLFYLLCCTCSLLIMGNKIVIEQTKNQVYAKIENVPIRETALVLGSRKNGKYGINPYFKYRMEAAISLYNAGKIKSIIVSGDNHHLSYNETEDMAKYLVKKGIPSTAIIKDFAGFRTLDSVIRAKKVFHKKDIIIVSQMFHNQKALFIANSIQIDAIAFNAKDVRSMHNFTHYRSYFAKCLAVIDIYILKTQPKFL